MGSVGVQAGLPLTIASYDWGTCEETIVNDKTKATDPELNLALYTDKGLEALIPKIEGELERRREEKTQDTLEKVQAMAAELGMTPEELVGLTGRGRKRRRRGKGSGIEWQHPDDPSKVYRGGAKPDWLKQLKEEGREPVKVKG